MRLWERLAPWLESLRSTTRRYEYYRTTTSVRELTEAEQKALDRAFKKFQEGFGEIEDVFFKRGQ